nr:hypothetical protein [Tanacetum cinerariifolium]
MSLVASVSRSTTREEEVVGIVSPGYAVSLRVVIPFRFSFGLVIVLPGSVPEPEDEAAEESGVDESELGKPELDKLVLDKVDVGFDLGLGALTGEATGSMIEEITGSELRIRDSVGITEGWTSSVLPLIEGLWLGFGAQTGEATGSMIGELTGSEVKIGDSDWTTEGWTSSVLPLLVGFTVSLVALVSHSTTGEEEVVGIVGPGYAIPLLVVIPFRSSFGLVIVLPGRVPKPEDKAAEESRVDEPELGKPELDKLVLDKLEGGYNLG